MNRLKNLLTINTWPDNLKYLALATFLMSMSLALKDTTFTNFANDLGIQPDQLGWIESIREVPGLLTVVMAMLTYLITESLLAALSLIALSLGMFIFSISTGFYWLVGASLIYSIGFHLFYPLQSAMALKMVSKEDSGKQLGLMGSIGSTAQLLGMGSVIILSQLLEIRHIFLIGMVLAFFGALTLFKMPRPEVHLKPKTLIFRKRYKFYYLLTFLSGCRRHIFTIFAPFVLVKIFDVNITTMATLMTVNQFLNIYTKQRIGKLIDAMGEKVALTINYGSLIFIFLGYAYSKSIMILFGLYILDNICFGFNMAVSTYLNKICSDEDLGPSLAMGSTINHIAAIFIPIIGGILWDTHGYQTVFYAGAIIVAISLVVTLSIKELGIKGLPEMKHSA